MLEIKANNNWISLKNLISGSKKSYLNFIFPISLVIILGLLPSCKTDNTKTVIDVITQENTETVTDSLGTNLLLWSQSERENRFRKIGDILPVATIKRGDSVRELPDGAVLEINLEIDGEQVSIDELMTRHNSIGMVILHNGEVRVEKYRNNTDNNTHWISFSVTKSMTSTLVGAAIADGYIKSIEEPITRYIPELIGSGYDGVSIEQVLTMTSGIKWNENYTDPEADVAKMQYIEVEEGQDPTIAYMKTLASEATPGSRWNYNTGETNLIGVLVSKATGKSLAAYLSEKIWTPFGMEQEASWVLNAGVSEYGGCCVSTSVRDFARFGLFVLEEMNAEDARILPEGWFEAAGKKQIEIGVEGRGYGYQWWTYDDGSFGASGIFGQGIFIDPARNLVIATNSNYKTAVGPEFTNSRTAFYQAVQKAIDSE